MKKIILNHKSYLNYDEIINFKKEIEKIKLENYELIIFPSIVYLSLFKDSSLNIGTQNFYAYNYGSYTGEINLESLKYIGINYTLIGHSERKKYKLESGEVTKDKTYKSLNANFKTILLVGEVQKDLNPFTIVKKQLNYYLSGIDKNNITHLSIAYEPAWAIGGSEKISASKIANMVEKIKKYILKKYDFDIEVYYGGSVTEDSVKEVLKVTDGVLIGKMSADIEKVKNIVKII